MIIDEIELESSCSYSSDSKSDSNHRLSELSLSPLQGLSRSMRASG